MRCGGTGEVCEVCEAAPDKCDCCAEMAACDECGGCGRMCDQCGETAEDCLCEPDEEEIEERMADERIDDYER